MSRPRSIALALSATLFAVSVAQFGAGAQQPPVAPTSAPQAQPSPGMLPVVPSPLVMPSVPTIPVGTAPVTTPPNGDLAGVTQQPFVGIALQDASGMALQRNTDLAIAQSNRRIANYEIVAVKGAYDVRFRLVPSYSHSVSPVTSPFGTNAQGGPVTQDVAGATAGIQGLTKTGGQYSVSIAGDGIRTNNAFGSYNPFYETALQFAITQPVARGFATDETRRQLQLSVANSAAVSANALLQASNNIVQVSDAYYTLVAAWRNVAVQEEGLRQTAAQAESNRRLAARGAVAPTDIVEANTQVDIFQENVYAAIQNVQRLQTQLKQLILANPADPVWLANLVPTTPVAEIPTEPSLTTLIASAIEKRPEISAIRAQRETSNINLAFTKDQLKPQVDLGLGYTTNGFAGTPLTTNPLFGALAAVPGINLSALPPPPAYQTGSLGKSFSNAFNNRFPTYQAQVALSIPVGNNTARANYAIAQEQQKQVQISETALLQRFRSEAVNAIQGLRVAQARLTAARAAREAAQRVLAGEQRRFQAGTSTTFLVLQRHLQVAQNEGLELQAQSDLDQAIVELNRVSGNIFAQNGVDISSLGTTSLGTAGATSVLPSPAPTAPPVGRRPL